MDHLAFEEPTRRRWSRGVAVAVASTFIALLLATWLAPYPAERLSYQGLESLRLVDRNGQPVAELRGNAGVFMRPVALEAVAPELVMATLSSEDAAFYWHPGIDPVAVGRALWLDVQARRLAYGGSTITQQLAKCLELRPRTVTSKLSEAWDAWRLERLLGKREILTQYLNRVSYGRLAVGVEAAAFRYYGKPASELTLDESALLAILPRAPSYYNPDKHPERAIQRRAHVLQKMAARGYITEAEAERARAAPIRLAPLTSQRNAPHFVDHLVTRSLLPDSAREVPLSLDGELQRALEETLRRHLAELERYGASQAGLVVLENATGEVLALVGSRRYGEVERAGSVNVVTSLRAPGSTLKPFVYALALEGGAQASSPVFDVPTHFAGYQPRNPRLTHQGALPLREALGSSLNVPAVRMTAEIGPEPIARLLRDAGATSVDVAGKYGLSIALGGISVPLLELANAYASLARGGLALPLRFLHGGPSGRPHRVLSASTAFLVTDILADPAARRREFGMETPLDLPFPAAAKTGTSQAYTDNVVVGYTPHVTVAVWVGNFDGKPLRGLVAMEGAAPLWRAAMLRASATRPATPFTVPGDVLRTEVCGDEQPLTDNACSRKRLEYVARANSSSIHAPDSLGARRSLRIVAPPPRAMFLIDPLLPRARQRVALGVEGAPSESARIRWFVNGTFIAESNASESAHWTLESGSIRLRADVAGTEETSEIEFLVKG